MSGTAVCLIVVFCIALVIFIIWYLMCRENRIYQQQMREIEDEAQWLTFANTMLDFDIVATRHKLYIRFLLKQKIMSNLVKRTML